MTPSERERMTVKRILAFLVMFLNVLVPAISARPHGNPVVSTPPTLTSFFGPSPSFNFAESFFEDISWPPCLKERPSTSAALKFDVQESSLEYLIKADVPGLSKDDVTIEIERDVFKLSTSLTEECRRLEKDVDEDAMKYIHRERICASKSRAIKLPQGIDSGKVKAALDNGVLTVQLPKVEADMPKQIKID